ncbi:MAG: type IV pilin protein [Ectobacillus sp.]
MFKRMLKNEKGVTLIELLAVIVILGIVAAIAIPSISSVIQKSKEDAVKADAIQVINAAKTYVAANGLEDTALDATDLADYVSDVDFKTKDGAAKGFVVNVSEGGKVFKLEAKGTAGSATITFDGATTKGIQADKGKGTRTIDE